MKIMAGDFATFKNFSVYTVAYDAGIDIFLLTNLEVNITHSLKKKKKNPLIFSLLKKI